MQREELGAVAALDPEQRRWCPTGSRGAEVTAWIRDRGGSGARRSLDPWKEGSRGEEAQGGGTEVVAGGAEVRD